MDPIDTGPVVKDNISQVFVENPNEDTNEDLGLTRVFNDDNSEEEPRNSDPIVNEENIDDDEACEWLDDGNEEEEDRLSLSLIGKLWTKRSLNPTAFMSTIKNVWVTQHGVDISMIGKNTFQFQFYHWKDKEKVLNGQPWHFDKVALLLTDMNAAQKPSNLQFYALPMWVRIYNIPFRGRFNENNARVLGEKIGEYVDMDKSESIGMEKSLRIRVRLDVRKPLKKHVNLKLRGGEVCQCPVKYEKLPLICFYCGMLGHGTNECKEAFRENSHVKNYGNWLKASPWKPIKNDYVQNEAVNDKSCSRKLFFTRKLTQKTPSEIPTNCIKTVTTSLIR